MTGGMQSLINISYLYYIYIIYTHTNVAIIGHPLANLSQHSVFPYHFMCTCRVIQFKIYNSNRNETSAKHRIITPPPPDPTLQSSVSFICSSGMGTKLSSTIDREASSRSQCGGTSCRIKSGRTESSVVYFRYFVFTKRHITHPRA